MPIKTNKIMFSADFGHKKSRTGLAYSEQLTYPDVELSLDYEHGQDYYIVDDPQNAKIGGPWFVERIIAPSLYDVNVILAAILAMKKNRPDQIKDQVEVNGELIWTPTLKILVNNKLTLVNFDLVGEETVAVIGKVYRKEISIRAILFDTITRVCELAITEEFGKAISEHGQAYADSMSMTIWGRVKDNISQILFMAVKLDINVIMTAWSKNAFDKRAKKPTDEMVADVLRNIHFITDLEIALTRNPREKGKNYLPPIGMVKKSRIEELPTDIILPECTWANILSAHPVWELAPDPEPVSTLITGVVAETESTS